MADLSERVNVFFCWWKSIRKASNRYEFVRRKCVPVSCHSELFSNIHRIVCISSRYFMPSYNPSDPLHCTAISLYRCTYIAVAHPVPISIYYVMRPAWLLVRVAYIKHYRIASIWQNVISLIVFSSLRSKRKKQNTQSLSVHVWVPVSARNQSDYHLSNPFAVVDCCVCVRKFVFCYTITIHTSKTTILWPRVYLFVLYYLRNAPAIHQTVEEWKNEIVQNTQKVRWAFLLELVCSTNLT